MFVLRAVDTEDHGNHDGVTLDLVRFLMDGDGVLTALDAATSEDPRQRGLAMRALGDVLARIREDVSAGARAQGRPARRPARPSRVSSPG